MKRIQTLNSKIQSVRNSMTEAVKPYHDSIAKLEAQLRKEWAKVFDKDMDIQADLKAIETSTEYGSNECGVYSWTRMKTEISRYIELEAIDFLKEYFSEHGYELDVENEALLNAQGDYIGINEEGDVWYEDAGTEWIVKRREYETADERNELIEAWMQRNGVFPGVFKFDRYGNPTLVNTQKKVKEA